MSALHNAMYRRAPQRDAGWTGSQARNSTAAPGQKRCFQYLNLSQYTLCHWYEGSAGTCSGPARLNTALYWYAFRIQTVLWKNTLASFLARLPKENRFLQWQCVCTSHTPLKLFWTRCLPFMINWREVETSCVMALSGYTKGGTPKLIFPAREGLQCNLTCSGQGGHKGECPRKPACLCTRTAWYRLC